MNTIKKWLNAKIKIKILSKERRKTFRIRCKNNAFFRKDYLPFYKNKYPAQECFEGDLNEMFRIWIMDKILFELTVDNKYNN